MENGISSESGYIRYLADTYRIQGYEAIEEPSPEQLPQFLSGFRPDLVVHKQG